MESNCTLKFGFLKRSVFVFSWDQCKSHEKQETMLMQNLEGKRKSIMVFSEVAYYLVEQGKKKLHLFEVILKTTLTQVNSKKLTPSLRGIQRTCLSLCMCEDVKALRKLAGHPHEHTRVEKRFPREMWIWRTKWMRNISIVMTYDNSLTADRALRALIDFTLSNDDLLDNGEPLGRERDNYRDRFS